MNAAARPSKATNCPECKGSGREIVTDDVTDETGEYIGETSHDFGDCEVCDGRGWFPRETAAQRRDREAQERTEERARRADEAREHQETSCPKLRGEVCHAPYRYHHDYWADEAKEQTEADPTAAAVAEASAATRDAVNARQEEDRAREQWAAPTQTEAGAMVWA